MQEDTRRAITERTESIFGLGVTSSPAFSAACNTIIPVGKVLLAVFPASHISSFSRFRPYLQTRGWGVKALEFINSGPPALLNNPRCSRRVVYSPFLKHAMEVHYG